MEFRDLVRPRKTRQCLLWLLIVLLPCLALGMAQRQTLGPLHMHPAPAALAPQAGAGLLQAAAQWWRHQVNTRAPAWQHAGAHSRAHSHGHAHAHSHAHAHGDVHSLTAHTHDRWQRHHHEPGDPRQQSLEAGADDLAGAAAASLLMLPVFGAPARSLGLADGAPACCAWPLAAAARFTSRGDAPPLQPPRG